MSAGRGESIQTEWLAAAARAVLRPAALATPFTEDALVDPARPVSLGYDTQPARGYFHVISMPKKCRKTSRFGLFLGFCCGLRI